MAHVHIVGELVACIVILNEIEKIKMRKLISALFSILTTNVYADGVAGEFDYYVMALSWSPNWCALEGDARQSPQCNPSEDFGWTLHGLWPQYEKGWPAYCKTTHSNPSRRQTNIMTDIMGSSGLAWHQWNKHGVCTGLSSSDYYELSRQTFENLNIPQVFRGLKTPVTLPASLVEEAFLEENPELDPNGITFTCRSGFIQEVRICLNRDMEYRRCGKDVIRDCSLDDAKFEPLR